MGDFRFRLGAFLLAFAAWAAFAGEELLKFVPAGTEYTVGVNAESLRNLSLFREMTGDGSDAGDVLAQFEKDYNLRFSDCRELLFVGGGARLRGLLAEISIPEADLARRLRSFGDRFSLEGEAGRKLYCIRTDNPAGLSATVGVAYLAPGIVLATERKYVAPYLAASAVPVEKRTARLIAPNGEPLVWSFIDVKSILAKSNRKDRDGLAGSMLKGLNTFSAELNAIGEGAFWRLDAVARCADEKSAQQLAFTVPVYLQLGASLLFSDDPVLGREFLQQVKIMPDGDRVVLELAVSRAFAERLVRYIGEQAKKRIIPPDPVPQDIRTQRPEDGRD